MKYKNIKTVILISFSTALLSCEKFVDNLNNDPNNFSGTTAENGITGAQLANVMVQEGELARTAGIFCSYFRGGDRQYLSLDKYATTSGDYSNVWNTVYVDGLSVTREVYELAKAKNNNSLMGVALINEAELLLTATSLWGDVPNTQACNIETYPNPKYDDQKSVYESIIKKLDDAISKSPSGYAEAYDAGFDWKEVANTLKARANLHLGNYAEAITAASSGIKDKAKDFKAKHPSAPQAGAWNIFFHFLYWERDGYLTCTDAWIVKQLQDDTLKSDIDTSNKRIDYYLKISGSDVNPNYTGSTNIFSSGSSYPLVTAVENYLILAESYMMTDNSAKALENLNKVRAIHKSVYGSGGFPSFESSDFTSMAKKGDLHKEIMLEKYLSLFGQIEGFNDLRRTNNILGITPHTGTGAMFPQRLLTSQDELNANPNAVSKNLYQKVDLFPGKGY